MNICVFCAANNIADVYVNGAKEFASLLADGGHALIWGAENKGLMKVIADTAQAKGSKLIGIALERLRESARPDIDELVVVEDNRKRNELLIGRADAIVALPGGLGTLNEVTEVLRMKKWMPDKLVVILNTNNFFDGLQTQLQRMDGEGFLTRPLGELVYFATTPHEAMEHINRYGRIDK